MKHATLSDIPYWVPPPRRREATAPRAYASIDFRGLHLILEAMDANGRLTEVGYQVDRETFEQAGRQQDIVGYVAREMGRRYADVVLAPLVHHAVLVARIARNVGIYQDVQGQERMSDAITAYRELEPQADDDELVRTLSAISAREWTDHRNCGRSLALSAHLAAERVA